MKFAAYAMPSFDESFGLTQGEFLRRTLDQLVSAEALGYDSVWVNEHHFHRYGGLMPSVSTMLAAIAQRTTKVRLGTSVVVLPLHHPLEVAEQLAMVDLLSNGRVEFGVGRGFVAHDYEVMGVTYGDAQDRLKESLARYSGRRGRASRSRTTALTTTSTTCRSGPGPSRRRIRRSGSPPRTRRPASSGPRSRATT